MSEFDEWHYRIKLAFQALVKAIGTQEAAGAICGVSDTTIGRYGDISPGNDNLPPLRAVLLLEAACGRPIVTSVMAARTGHDLLPTAEREAKECLTQAHAKMSRLHGELQSAYLEAQADGKLSAAEIKELTGLYGQITGVLGNAQGAAAVRLQAIAGGRCDEGAAA